MSPITYKDAGVDIEKADRAIDSLKARIQSTFKPFVLNPIGGFGSLTALPEGYRNPVLVSSTDGVGTKLKIAFLAGKHDTVGIDLVAMSANDVLTLGARPLFFLDYFACGRLEERVYRDVIAGICDGCSMADCALIGGETAEMPSFYPDGEYDLAGFVVGIVERDRIVDGSGIREGDAVLGLPSSGLHSNGYSLVRKILLDAHRVDVRSNLPPLQGPLYEELLRPTRIYAKAVLSCLDTGALRGMAHITGGGITGNIKRIIPDGLTAAISVPEERVLTIFRLLQDMGEVPDLEMYATFNMGIGFVLIVAASALDEVVTKLGEGGEEPVLLGRIEKSSGSEKVSLR